MLKAIKSGKDKQGNRVCVATEDGVKFGVLREHNNYSAGRMVKSWRYIQYKMTRDEAVALFDKKFSQAVAA